MHNGSFEFDHAGLRNRSSRQRFEYRIELERCHACPNPEDVLDPYFEQVIAEALKAKLGVKCNFVPLEYMNSASIPPLIALLRTLADKKIQGEFVYDSNRKVQSASFRALDVIARKSKYTSVRGI